MRFSDWELEGGRKSRCGHGQSHLSIYRAASPRGETIFHLGYNVEEERGAGEEKQRGTKKTQRLFLVASYSLLLYVPKRL